MPNKDIPRDEWVHFLDRFSRGHRTEVVSVQATEAGVKNKPEARDLPLIGISADLKHGDDDTVEIMLGDTSTPPFNHLLSKVQRITLQQNDRGEDSGLMIQGKDGTATLVLRTPARPQDVNTASRARH